MGTKNLFKSKYEENELSDLFVPSNRIMSLGLDENNSFNKPKKLFLHIPHRDLHNYKFQEVKPSRFYNSYISQYNDLPKYEQIEEQKSMKKLLEMYKYICCDILPNVNPYSGLHTVLTGILDTIKLVYDMGINSRDIHKAKVANFSVRTILEHSYKYCNDINIEDDISRSYKPHRWGKRLSRYNPSAHSNLKDIILRIKRIQRDIEFCYDEVMSK